MNYSRIKLSIVSVNKIILSLLFLSSVFFINVSAQQTVNIDENTELEVNDNSIKIDTSTDNTNSTVKVTSSSTNTALITIDNPGVGQTISNSSLVVSGKSPAGVLIDILLSYDQATNIFNMNSQKAYFGTVTSDQNGEWAYVPPRNVPEGTYSVSASFTDSNENIVKSEISSFYVTSAQNNLLIVVMILFPVIVLAILFFTTRKYIKLKKTTRFDLPIKKVSSRMSITDFIEDAESRELPMISSNIDPADLNKDGRIDYKDVELAQKDLVNTALQVKEIQERQEIEKIPKNIVAENTQEAYNDKDTAKNILDLLKHNPQLTRNELASKLGITPDGVKYHLKNLEDLKKLKREGSRKSGHWVVKG